MQPTWGGWGGWRDVEEVDMKGPEGDAEPSFSREM